MSELYPNKVSKVPEANKNDTDKARMDLLAPDALVGLAKVLGFGAKTYEARNWELGMDWGRFYAALQRHLNAYWSGADIDEESGLPHIDHALCCCMFLSAYQKRGIGKDTRNKLKTKKSISLKDKSFYERNQSSMSGWYNPKWDKYTRYLQGYQIAPYFSFSSDEERRIYLEDFIKRYKPLVNPDLEKAYDQTYRHYSKDK